MEGKHPPRGVMALGAQLGELGVARGAHESSPGRGFCSTCTTQPRAVSSRTHRHKPSFRMGLGYLGLSTHQGLGHSFAVRSYGSRCRGLAKSKRSKNNTSNKEAPEALMK